MAEYIEREALLNDLRGSYNDLMQIYKELNYDEERQIVWDSSAPFWSVFCE